MAKNVKITLTAKDNGSKTVKKFSSNTTESMGKVNKSTVDTNKSFSTMISKFKLLTAAAVSFGTAATIALGKNAVQAASDYQETLGKFSVVFREQTALAEAFAAELEKSYGLSIIESRKYLSSVQDLLKPMGMASAAAAEMSNKVVKLAVDLGSFNNVKTEKVMEDIQSALVGNFETMKKYGVILNETVVKEEAYNSGLAKRGDTLNALKKSQAAYTLIVKGSTDALGDWARTSTGFANQMKVLNSNMENFKVLVGGELLVRVNEIITAINKWAATGDNLTKSVDNLFKILKVLKDAIMSLLALVVIKKVYNLITSITIGIATMGKLSVAIGVLKGRLVHLLLQFKYLGLACLNPVFLTVTASIAAIGAAMYLQAGKTRKAKEAMDEYTNALKEMSAVDLRIKIAEGTSLIIDQQKIIDNFQKKLKESMNAGVTGRGLMGFGAMAQGARDAEKEIDKLLIKQNLAKDLLFELSKKKIDTKSSSGATMGDWEIIPTSKKLTFDEQVAAALAADKAEKAMWQENFNAYAEHLDSKYAYLKEESDKEKALNDANDTYWKEKIKSMAQSAKDLADAMAEETAQIAAQLGDAISAGLTDGIFEWIDGVKSAGEAFKDFASSFLREIAKMIIQQGILNALKGTMGAASGFLPTAVQSVFGFAKGGVVNKPTMFPMANGAGLMGEAGPEAIMPLKRGANGKLGVEGGGGGNTTINVKVEASGRSPDEAKREGAMIAESIKQQIRQIIQYEQKSNGLLNRQPAF